MKTIKTLFTALLMTAALTMTAFAAGSIDKLTITVDTEKQDPGIVWTASPSVNTSDCVITDYEWSKDYEKWTPGTAVTLTVTLESEEKTFDSNVKVTVKNGTLKSQTRTPFSLTVKISYVPEVTLASVTNVRYEGSYTLHWDKVQYASGYEVRLYKDDATSAFKTLSVDGTSVNLAQYATDEYDLGIAIRAVPSSSKKSYITASEWYKPDDVYTTASEESTVYGSFSGSGSKLRFKDSYTETWADGWQLINGTWYWFDENNSHYAAADGLKVIDGVTYAFDSNGKMVTGWYKDGGNWYYMRSSGAMAHGWIQDGPNGLWYYLSPTETDKYPEGAMYYSDTTPDGYYVNTSGAWE